LVVEKLQPMPKIRSALVRKWWRGLEMERPPEPSERGCVSGKALLPCRLVVTGASSSSASSRSARQARA
jgi:hypothetical protein